MLQPLELTVVEAKVVTANLEPLVFQNVVLNTAIADASLQKVVFLQYCVGTVSEPGHVFISVMDFTSNPQRIRGITHLDTVVPVSLIFKAVPQHVDDPKTNLKSKTTMLILVMKCMNQRNQLLPRNLSFCRLRILLRNAFQTMKNVSAQIPC